MNDPFERMGKCYVLGCPGKGNDVARERDRYREALKQACGYMIACYDKQLPPNPVKVQDFIFACSVAPDEQCPLCCDPSGGHDHGCPAPRTEQANGDE